MAKTFVGLLLVSIFLTPVLADESTDYLSYISALSDFEKKDFSNLVLKEFQEYRLRYPNAKSLDEVVFNIATIYGDRKNEERAFFTNLELIYMFPKSKHIPVAKDRVRALLLQERKFRPLKEKVETILNPTTLDSTKEGAHFALISDLFSYNFDRINDILVESTELFLSRYSEMPKADAVLYWKAQLLEREGEAPEAISELLKLTYLYRNSVFATASKLKMAELFTESLKMHDKAILALEEFILEFPNDPQASYAQFKIAQILEKRKGKDLEALNGYKAVADRFPQSIEAVPALFEAARLYEEEFKEYDQAIRIYTEVVRDFPEDIKAPYALAEAARIYEKRLKDYLNAANVYFKVYGHYPESNIAAQSLYAAADINEKRLKDLNKALMYYRFVVDHYPNEKLASDASKRIEKISKELASEK